MIDYNLRLGGSGYGVSYWSKWLNGPCGRLEEHRESMEERFGPSKGSKENKGMNIGTLVHGFMDLWLSRPESMLAFQDVRFLPTDHGAIQNPQHREQAERVFSWFQMTYPQSLFVGHHKTEQVVRLLDGQMFGVPYTAAYDLKKSFTDAGQLQEFNTHFNKNLTLGDTVIVDWKCLSVSAAQMEDFRIDLYVDSLQKSCYMLADEVWGKISGEPVADYFLHFFILRPEAQGVPPSVVTVQYDRPGLAEREIVRHFLQTAKEERDRWMGRPNPTKCYGFRGYKCALLDKGCTRF